MLKEIAMVPWASLKMALLTISMTTLAEQAQRLRPATADYMVAVVSIFDFKVTIFSKENAKVSFVANSHIATS